MPRVEDEDEGRGRGGARGGALPSPSPRRVLPSLTFRAAANRIQPSLSADEQPVSDHRGQPSSIRSTPAPFTRSARALAFDRSDSRRGVPISTRMPRDWSGPSRKSVSTGTSHSPSSNYLSWSTNTWSTTLERGTTRGSTTNCSNERRRPQRPATKSTVVSASADYSATTIMRPPEPFGRVFAPYGVPRRRKTPFRYHASLS